jgi:hypothetical protein
MFTSESHHTGSTADASQKHVFALYVHIPHLEVIWSGTICIQIPPCQVSVVTSVLPMI